MHVEHALVEVDVVPVQAEGFALAHAGADQDLEQIGRLRVGRVAVSEKGAGPDGAVAATTVRPGVCGAGVSGRLLVLAGGFDAVRLPGGEVVVGGDVLARHQQAGVERRVQGV